ncbi:hypothetical protein Tco_0337400 [Tanacetum coccineum]
MESSVQFICVFCGSLSDEYGCPCSTCKLCGNDAHYGYDCLSQVLFVYNQDPCFNQNLNNFPQTSPSFPHQYLCCEDCRVPHATFECQPMNQNFYEPNFCYNSNSFGFNQFQPPQYPVIHQPRQEMSTEMLLAKEKLIKAIRTCLKNNNQPPEEKSIAVLLDEKSILTVMQTLEEKHNDTEIMQELLLQLSKDLQTLGNTSNQLKQEEQAAKICTPYWKCPIFDNDDDEEYTIQVREYYMNSPVTITPDFPITNSLIMEDEHLDTIPKTELDEEIESSVKDLNLTPSESEDLSDYVSECDLPFCDNSPDFNKDYEIFSNPLFDSDADYTSSDDESFSDEDVPKENFKIYSNPLFNEEIISTKIDTHHFNAKSNLIESLLNKDTVITSPKIDFLLEEFTDIRLIKKLLYDNSSPRPSEELNSENDFEKENSGSTTIHTYISLLKYKSFDDKSDVASEIFNDELAHIISPSEYEYVYADDESDSGDLTIDVVEYILGDSTRKLQMSHWSFKALKISHNSLNKSPMMIYVGYMPILNVSYLHFYPP